MKKKSQLMEFKFAFSKILNKLKLLGLDCVLRLPEIRRFVLRSNFRVKCVEEVT